jgi:hypothetical protein
MEHNFDRSIKPSGVRLKPQEDSHKIWKENILDKVKGWLRAGNRINQKRKMVPVL